MKEAKFQERRVAGTSQNKKQVGKLLKFIDERRMQLTPGSSLIEIGLCHLN